MLQAKEKLVLARKECGCHERGVDSLLNRTAVDA